MKTHFKHEEKFMQEINYPKFEEHKILHHDIIEKINTFVKQLPNFDESLDEPTVLPSKIPNLLAFNHTASCSTENNHEEKQRGVSFSFNDLVNISKF
jgi:hemerythrin